MYFIEGEEIGGESGEDCFKIESGAVIVIDFDLFVGEDDLN